MPAHVMFPHIPQTRNPITVTRSQIKDHLWYVPKLTISGKDYAIIPRDFVMGKAYLNLYNCVKVFQQRHRNQSRNWPDNQLCPESSHRE